MRSAPEPPRVVFKDRHLLIVHKPSGLATTAPDRRESLTRWAEAHIGDKLHPTSRLDAEVTGLVTFTRTKTAAKRLQDARREGRYGRGYLAIASGRPTADRGTWERSIAIDPRDRRLRVAVEPGARGRRVQHAKSGYFLRAFLADHDVSALYLRPHTGRTHQLRVHAADAGHPLLGDVRYGGPRRLTDSEGRVFSAARTMLHCTYLRLPRIRGEGEMVIEDPAPSDLRALWAALGGHPDALVSHPTPAD